MKKNITINLFDQLYHIDEDAYELLKNYEESMRRYFASKEGGDEIIDDIEHRVAELLSEIKNSGVNAITIEHVQEIIHRIGNPEQIDTETEDNESENKGAYPPHSSSHGQDTEQEYEAPSRRLYRDVKESMLGGVSSGLGHYFGIGDPIFIRLAWVLLFLLSASTAFIIYVILWIVMPPAITTEDRLRMCRKPVTPQTLNEEILQASQFTREKQQPNRSKGVLHNILDVALTLCAFAFKAIIFGALCIFLLIVLISVLALLFFNFSSPCFFHVPGFLDADTACFFQALHAQSWYMWLLLGTSVVALGLPLYILIQRIMKKERKPSNRSRRWVLAVIWLICLAIAIMLTISVSFNVEAEQKEQRRLNNTRNGIYLTGRSWGILDEGNWKIEDWKNAESRAYSYCSNLFHKGAEIPYIRVKNAGQNIGMKVTLKRKTDTEPGIYQIEAIAAANGSGCFLYAQSPDTTAIRFTAIPFNLRKGFLIENMNWKKSQETHYFKNATDSIGWKVVQENSDHENWCYVVGQPFPHKGGIIEYGITNDTEFTNHPWTGKEFKIYDIVLTRIGDLSEK